MKKTAWFTDRQPWEDGVYERAFDPAFGPDNHGYSRYEGGIWYFRAFTPDQAEKTRMASSLQSLPWRGLTKEAK